MSEPIRCSLELRVSGHALDDLVGSLSQGKQITVTTDRRIELETEWKPSIGG